MSPELRLRARRNHRRVVLPGLLTGLGVFVGGILVVGLFARHHHPAIAHRRVTGTARAFDVAVPVALLLLFVVLGVVAARRGWFQPSALWALDRRERRQVWRAARRSEPLPDEMKPLVVEQAVATQRLGTMAWIWVILAVAELTLAILSVVRGHADAMGFVLAGLFAALVVPMRKQAAIARRIEAQYG